MQTVERQISLVMTTENAFPPLVPNRPISEMIEHPALSNSSDALTLQDLFLRASVRDSYIADYGFAIVTKECCDALANMLKGLKCLDAGAGTGWLCHVLSEQGIDMTASEKHLTENGYGFKKFWRNDHHGDTVPLLPGEFDAVLLVWPPFENDFGFKIISAMEPRQMLIYQGEGAGGCTGNDAMHESLEDNSKWQRDFHAEAQLNAHHLQFERKHDAWYVLRKLAM